MKTITLLTSVCLGCGLLTGCAPRAAVYGVDSTYYRTAPATYYYQDRYYRYPTSTYYRPAYTRYPSSYYYHRNYYGSPDYYPVVYNRYPVGYYNYPYGGFGPYSYGYNYPYNTTAVSFSMGTWY